MNLFFNRNIAAALLLAIPAYLLPFIAVLLARYLTRFPLFSDSHGLIIGAVSLIWFICLVGLCHYSFKYISRIFNSVFKALRKEGASDE